MRLRRWWLTCAVTAVLTVLSLPVAALAQESTPPAGYAPMVRAAHARMPEALALSSDGHWLASFSYERMDTTATVATAVTVLATTGRDSFVVPLRGCDTAMAWAPAGDRLALVCQAPRSAGRTLYLWRPGAAHVDSVGTAPVHGSIQVLTWQSAGRLVYATTEPRTPRLPALASTRSARDSAGRSASPRPATTDSSCAAIGIGRHTVAALCSDSVDVLRSRARAQPANDGLSTSRHSSRADSMVTQVMVYDVAARTSTVVATIRGRPRDLIPLPDGQGLMVVAAGAPAPDTAPPVRPSQRVDVMRFAASGTGAPPLLDLTDASAAPDPRVIRVLTGEPIASRGLAIAPDGRAVAFLRSWYNRMHGEDVVEDSVFLASVEPNAVPEAVALNLTGDAEADTSRALQWVIDDRSSTKTQLPVWTPDGTRLVVASHGQLWRIDAAARQAHRLSTGLGRSVADVLWVSDREALVATYNRLTGESGVWWVTLVTGAWRRGYEAPQAASHVVAASGGAARPNTVAYVGSTLRTSPSLYTVRLGPDGRQVGPPQSLTPHALSVSLPATRDTLVAYQVAPGQWGATFLVRPVAVEGPVATIVMGYPGSLYSRYARRFGFADLMHGDVFAAVARGYAVMLVDIPLPPYGEYGEQGPAAAIVHGVTAALDAVARTGWVDTTRLGVIGYSYGGYMVNLLVTRTSRFQAAVSGAGKADLVSFAAGGSIYGPERDQYHQGRMEKSLVEAPARYVLNSPILHLDSVVTPLLLVHGVRDDNVHISQAEELFRSLAQRGKVVELVRYHGAGHGCDPNRACRLLDGMWARAFDWFDKYLRPERSPEEPEAQSPTAME